MFQLTIGFLFLLSCVSAHAERIPFLARDGADRLVVQTHLGDTCPVSEEQMRDTVHEVLAASGIEPVAFDAPSVLRFVISAGCLPNGGASLDVRFLDDVKLTMITHLNTRVDASSGGLLEAVRAATEDAMIDYVDSNPELQRR